MLLGDYELSDLKDTTGVTVLFIIFISVGVVILLNVLIAVVSDSYEKATLSSTLLFGRARAMFVAQNEALEAFLRPGATPISVFNGSHKSAFTRCILPLFRWIVLLAIIGTACDTAFFLISIGLELVHESETNKWTLALSILRKFYGRE